MSSTKVSGIQDAAAVPGANFSAGPGLRATGVGCFLETKRLQLRPYRSGDDARVLRFIRENRKRLGPYLPEWALEVEDDQGAARLIRRARAGWKLDRIYLLGMWTRERNELAGELVLFNVDREHASAEIGYYVAARYQGLGLVTEAVNALLAVTRDRLGFESISARCASDNVRSLTLAMRCGFTVLSNRSGEVCLERSLASARTPGRLPSESLAHPETPVVIRSAQAVIYGILARPEGATQVVVLLPAPDGTRQGPQRLFVEIARSLVAAGIASLRVDLAGTGDSLPAPSGSMPTDAEVPNRYRITLDSVSAFLKRSNAFQETILLTISYGSRAAVEYARERSISRIVLLSPSRVVSEARVVRKDILRAYHWKLFRPESWKKIVTLRFHPIRIASILIGALALRRIDRGRETPARGCAGARSPLQALCLFGEKDPAGRESEEFWRTYIQRGGPATMRSAFVLGSDHSFFGWGFKAQVCDIVSKWVGSK